MSITRDHSTDTCCINLNPAEHKNSNKDALIDSLLHEKGHAVYHDGFNNRQISTLLLKYSPAVKKFAALRKEYYTELKECHNEWLKNTKNDAALFKINDIDCKIKKNNLEHLKFTQDVSKNMSPYRKSQEIRADVYAAITSPQQGDGFITSLQKDLQEESQGRLRIIYDNHPHHKGRIVLLQQIKSELQSAEQEKQCMTRAMCTMSDDQTF
ncbi:MAG: hypothetical protein M1114_06375 [Candidatus Dependentiae bacterium]|nr:hypothetical protein [Candidatus Dependentiae bacterium]